MCNWKVQWAGVGLGEDEGLWVEVMGMYSGQLQWVGVVLGVGIGVGVVVSFNGNSSRCSDVEVGVQGCRRVGVRIIVTGMYSG